MELQKSQDRQKLVLDLSGELNLDTYQDLNQTLAEVNPAATVIIDLSRTTVINSSGVGTLMRFAHEVSRSGGVCTFRNIPPHAEKVFRLLGLEQTFGLAPVPARN